MLRTYPISLAMNTTEATYSLMLGSEVIATLEADEPMTGMDALRELLGVKP